MDRYWLLTTTFYGTWLPGDRRGFVSQVRDRRENEPETLVRQEHNVPGTAYDRDLPGLHRAAQEQMKGPPIYITTDQAAVLGARFHETASHRGWQLRAVAIMANHLHIVVGVKGDPKPTKILGDFKAWGSRALSSRWSTPTSETWWTYGGSKRKLATEEALRAAIEYVRNQEYPLYLWIAD